jgi:hypothetical protein
MPLDAGVYRRILPLIRDDTSKGVEGEYVFPLFERCVHGGTAIDVAA